MGAIKVRRRHFSAGGSSVFTCTTDGDSGAAVGGCACGQPALRAAARRITRELSRRGGLAATASTVAALGLASRAYAAARPEGLTFMAARVRAPSLAIQ
jgi:hypothetical protein